MYLLTISCQKDTATTRKYNNIPPGTSTNTIMSFKLRADWRVALLGAGLVASSGAALYKYHYGERERGLAKLLIGVLLLLLQSA